MAKITENAVLFRKSDHSQQLFADKVDKDGNAIPFKAPKGTKRIMRLTTSKDPFDGKPFDVVPLEDAFTPDISTLPGVLKWIEGFNNLPCQPRSGYDSFVNDHGPTNPTSPNRFSPRGTLRCVLAYMQALFLKVAEGGEDWEDAQLMLMLIPQYATVAGEKVKDLVKKHEADRLKALAEAKAKELGDDIDPEDLRAFLAERKARKEAASQAALAAIGATDTGTIAEPVAQAIIPHTEVTVEALEDGEEEIEGGEVSEEVPELVAEVVTTPVVAPARKGRNRKDL
jgi:hypothetical protein